MRRGFDELANPAGMMFVIALGLLLLGGIIAGAVFVRAHEREQKRRRQESEAPSPSEDAR